MPVNLTTSLIHSSFVSNTRTFAVNSCINNSWDSNVSITETDFMSESTYISVTLFGCQWIKL